MSLSATLYSPTRSDRLRVGSGRRSPRRPTAPGGEATSQTRRPSPAAEATDDLESSSDEDLLGHYREDREPESLAELLRRYSGELHRYLARYLGDAILAEDVLQDVFLLVHAKCSLYRDGWPARPWLYAVARHRAIDVLRRARHRPALRLDSPQVGDDPGPLAELLASTEPGPLEELQERERQRWVCESLARLPELQRQTLELSYYQGLPDAEIACLLGIPLGTVKSRLHCAIARLRVLAERYNRAGEP
ncbi:RNA polymerase sigma factor [Paludisphaera borealis]|uniref:RNA polymerase sigma factor n=1 Tax=Paludisphaera borealis TaxID=1387353 RepID=UPI000BFFDB6F|nr:sigma-70 family RNA polymerase sigma factor [Paludisphaera borealis]